MLNEFSPLGCLQAEINCLDKTGILKNQTLSMIKKLNGGLTSHGRKVFEELVRRLPVF